MNVLQTMDLTAWPGPAIDGTGVFERSHPTSQGAGKVARQPEDIRHALIMIVDDEPINVKVVRKYLQDAGYDNFATATDSRLALSMIGQRQPDVIVLDVMMPHITGLEILAQLRQQIKLRHVPVLILTADSDAQTKLKSLELGATDFLNKPVQPSELVARIRNMLVLKAQHDRLARYSEQLKHEVHLRTAELAESRQELIHVLACAAEYRDQETGNHVLRVSRYAGIISRQLGSNEEQAQLMELAAVLHDVGKIGIPDAVLLKPGKLDQAEMHVMRNHCEYGKRILMGMPCYTRSPVPYHSAFRRMSRSPILELAASIAISHHEKWDGSGYPFGLRGEEIPLEGRITAVADVFDALVSKRPYKQAIPIDRSFEIMKEGRGSHFDPAVLGAFLERRQDILDVYLELADIPRGNDE